VLGATHSFASKWWSWPILYKPMWYFSGKSLVQWKTSTIVAMGNPAIWWIGIPAIFYGSYLAFKKRDKGLTVIITAFIYQYVPWIYVERLTFIYHFFSSIPFVILIIVYIIKHFVEKYENTKYARITKYTVGLYMFSVLVLFKMFYPAISGMEVSSSYIENYLKWFKNVWYF
jgi:dolichyl-phosphate-mannose--protein O-mannosyl transferase